MTFYRGHYDKCCIRVGDKMNDDVKQVITETVNQTVLKLKMAGLMKDDRKTAFQKTEELLRNYTTFQQSDQEYTKKLVNRMDKALEEISSDIYYKLLPMIYFENCTREECAEYFDTTVTTVSRNKTRLVNRLKNYLFSDDVIFELFL